MKLQNYLAQTRQTIGDYDRTTDTILVFALFDKTMSTNFEDIKRWMRKNRKNPLYSTAYRYTNNLITIN